MANRGGWVGVGIAIVIGVAAAAYADENPPDKYLCYQGGTPASKKLAPIAGATVSIEDRRGGPTDFVMRRLASLCNAASVNASVISHETIHLEGITIKKTKKAPKFVPETHVTTDQFGTRTLSLVAPSSFLDVTPAQPGTNIPAYFNDDPTHSATEVNRFKCYAAVKPKGEPKFVPPSPPVVKDDVFPNGQAFLVKKVTQVCLAADVDDGTPGAESRPHALVCYAVKLPSGVKYLRETVGTHGRVAGPRVVGRRKPAELCVPATVS